MTDRISFALNSGGLELPVGRLAVFDPALDADVPTQHVDIITGHRPSFEAWQRRGATVRVAPEDTYAGAIVTLGRARDRNEARLAQAAKAAPGQPIIVNGAKTDGIESILKAVKKLVPIQGTVSKAHGKCIWFTSDPALDALARPVMTENKHGDWTAPGVFSADAPDAGSVALAAALPALKGTVGDLGAGWGWLSREILKQSTVKTLHLVEADHAALDCAQRNVTDPRAKFHWADATRWFSPSLLDAVVMNPPFHTGRKGDPGLGQAFIQAAARSLAPSGQLYMVANRHLPYEQTLAECFRDCAEIGGTSGFKVLHASRPHRR